MNKLDNLFIDLSYLIEENEEKMRAYNLTFLDLEEGKVYENNVSYSRYTIKNGRLFSLELNENSQLSQKQLKGTRFKEIIENPFTENEKLFLRMIKNKYKWIAKDLNGEIWFYENKPYKNTTMWFLEAADLYVTKNHTGLKFKGISWNDKEPVEFRKFI